MNFELFVSKTLLLFLIDFRWLLFYWIGVVLVDLCKGLRLYLFIFFRSGGDGIFMVIAKNSGKDNSDKEIYEVDESGERLLGEYNHLIQKHDLKKNCKCV